MSDIDNKIFLWFDIDNTLYSRALGIADLMQERLHQYFVGLGLSEKEAHETHMAYFTQYGLAIRGLVQHHTIDPLDFDARCDGSLPLDTILHPTPELSRFFNDIDRNKAHIWAITNAYKTHASRVLSLLEIDQHFENVVYCNYEDANLSCKPQKEFYDSALATAGNPDPSRCYFIDDSLINVQAAKAQGWGSCVYFQELLNASTEPVSPEAVGVDHVIHNLDGLRTIWPNVFKNIQ